MNEPTTYTNPVWDGYLADPFVLKWQGEYWAYGTGTAVGNEGDPDQRIFPCLHSFDLAEWELVGGALEPLQDPPRVDYWAPEVAVCGGRFYMYYSVAEGDTDETHRLHVAVADHPAGPYKDVRALMPDLGFSIDAHPFQDSRDGEWYLYFARDYFDQRAGTGTTVIRLSSDMVSVVGDPAVVLRASADWQIYQRHRTIYGRTWDAWHTVEGPFVVEQNGLYYCFYSGGNWQHSGYGVSYGVAEHPMGPFRDDASQNGPEVLRGIPGQVIGPGHNSIALGPDDQTQFIVYHAWDPEGTARRMFIDRLLWTPGGPRCHGPTTTPQPL